MDNNYNTIDRFIDLGSTYYIELMNSLPDIYDSRNNSLKTKINYFKEYSLFKEDIERSLINKNLSTRQKALMSDLQHKIKTTDKKLHSRLKQSIDDINFSIEEERTKNYKYLFNELERVRKISYSLNYDDLLNKSTEKLEEKIKTDLFKHNKIEVYEIYSDKKKGLIISYTNGKKELKQDEKQFLYSQRSKRIKKTTYSFIKKTLGYAAIFALGVGLSYFLMTKNELENKTSNHNFETKTLAENHVLKKKLKEEEDNNQRKTKQKTKDYQHAKKNTNQKINKTARPKTKKQTETKVKLYNWIDRGGN